MQHGGPSPVTANGAPACTACTDKPNFIKILLLLFKNTPAGGIQHPPKHIGPSMTRDLSRLLQPKSIAVIGGGSWCDNVIQQSRQFGFTGPIWPVHPTKPQIAEEPAYQSIEEMPGSPDAAFIGINRHATIQAVAALSARNAGGAVCFASGFLEAKQETIDGADLQQQLLKAAGGMPILGPNCYGFINYLDGALLWPDQQGGTRTDRGVAIITQSSNIAINITMQRRALPLAYLVTAGNQAQTGLAEIGATLLQDPRVSALGLHIEGINDIRALETMATIARTHNKPIIALKIGRSDQAAVATVSHTASLAGSDAGARALLKRLNISQVHTLPEFIEALKLLHIAGPLKSNRIASMSCSGGEASLIADIATSHDLRFPPLNARQKTDLHTALGPMVNLSNPLDYHTYIWNDASKMANAFTAMMDPDLALGIVISDFPRADRCEPTDWDCVLDAVQQAHTRTDIAMAIAASLPENMPEDVAARLMASGITPLNGLSEALTAARVAAECGKPPANSAPTLLPRPPINCKTLPESLAKAELAQFGLNTPNSRQTDNQNSLPSLADELTFPLVLKAQGITHKTEHNAVFLNLTSSKQVTDAAQTMQAKSYILEEMITDIVAELLIGVVLDPAHGYVLTLGAGGILTELLLDTVSLLVPASAKDIKTALSALKIHQILQGYRGQPAADINAIVDAALSVQTYVIANHGQIEEVEINPLLALKSGAVAADALIRIGENDVRKPD